MILAGFGLPRQSRLRKRPDYLRVQDGGRHIRQPHLLLLFLPGRADASRVGLTVSKKVGNAVMRNRVKRWLREAVRHERTGLRGCWDVVVIAHPSALHAGYTALREQISSAFSRVGGSARPSSGPRASSVRPAGARP